MAITLVDTAKANVFEVASTGVTVTHGFTLQNNDVLVAIVGQGDNSGTALASSSGGTWTATGFAADATQDDRTIAAVYRRVTDAGSEPSSYTFTFNAATSETMAVVVLQLRGVDATTAIDATATTSVGVDDFTPSNPAITTVTDGAMVVVAHLAVLGDGVASGKTGGAPSGYTLADTEAFSAGTDLFELFLEVATKTVGTAGTETPGAWTGSPDAGTEEYALLTMAFRPAAESGVTISVPVGTFAAVGLAATLAISGAVSIGTPVGSATATGLAPVASQGQIIAVPAGSIAATGQFVAPTFQGPGVGSAVITGHAPTLDATAHQTVTPGVGSATATGLAPSLTEGTPGTVAPDTGSVVASGHAPTLAYSWVITPPLGSISATGRIPTIRNSELAVDHWNALTAMSGNSGGGDITED